MLRDIMLRCSEVGSSCCIECSQRANILFQGVIADVLSCSLDQIILDGALPSGRESQIYDLVQVPKVDFELHQMPGALQKLLPHFGTALAQ